MWSKLVWDWDLPGHQNELLEDVIIHGNCAVPSLCELVWDSELAGHQKELLEDVIEHSKCAVLSPCEVVWDSELNGHQKELLEDVIAHSKCAALSLCEVNWFGTQSFLVIKRNSWRMSSNLVSVRYCRYVKWTGLELSCEDLDLLWGTVVCLPPSRWKL